jgi:hypothetical protein
VREVIDGVDINNAWRKPYGRDVGGVKAKLGELCITATDMNAPHFKNYGSHCYFGASRNVSTSFNKNTALIRSVSRAARVLRDFVPRVQGKASYRPHDRPRAQHPAFPRYYSPARKYTRPVARDMAGRELGRSVKPFDTCLCAAGITLPRDS